MIQRGIDTDAISYSYALERRLQFVADMAMLTSEVDILMTPSTPTPALPDVTNTGNTIFQGPWTYCGLPAITIPSGISASGMPLGIQLASGNFQETVLLSSAKWCESVLNVELCPDI
jgi:aspartyl-tRNA(Asn)/glutamyl-tRNA(Gln) amidotransferase subunit A